MRAIFTHNSRDRPLTIDVKDGETSYLDLDYTYDNNNNITQLVNRWRDTESDWNSDTESYNYDGLDRSTSASCTFWSHTFSYDKAGNITAKDGITYSINAVNEVTSLSDGTSFTYNDNGNRIQKTKGTDTWVYTYDYADRLTKVEKNSTTIGEYVYDGDGKRLQATENSVTTTYLYNGTDVLYEENTNGTACYIYGPVGRLAKRTTVNQESNTYYYHTDHLGSTRLVTDSTKNIVSAATYHPFGKTSVKEGSESFLFTGKEEDSTGLHYFMGRYYDASIGRFLTRDSRFGNIYRPQTLNKYSYCLNNPLKFIDPDGRWESVELLREDPSTDPPKGEWPSLPPLSTTEKIIALASLILASISFALLFSAFGGWLAGFIGAAAVVALGKIVGGLAIAIAIIGIYLTFGKEKADALQLAIDEFLEEEGYAWEKNLKKLTQHEVKEGRVILTIEEDDGTIRTVVFELNDDGEWEKVYDSAEEHKQGGEGDGGNEGGEGDGGNEGGEGGDSSSGPPVPPGNNNGPAGVF